MPTTSLIFIKLTLNTPAVINMVEIVVEDLTDYNFIKTFDGNDPRILEYHKHLEFTNWNRGGRYLM